MINSTAGISVYAYEQPPVGTAVAYPAAWTHFQDWRDIGPVHAGNANVLFADGSIRSIKDKNKDGYINPGFNVDTNCNATTIAKLGYKDQVNEMPVETGVFSGMFLRKYSAKEKLD